MDTEYQRFLDEAKNYIGLRYRMLKLELLEKLSSIIAVLVLVLIVVVLLLAALTYFAIAAAYALKPILGGIGYSFCLLGGIFVILVAIIALLRKPLIVNPLIKSLSAILFNENEEDETTDIK